MSLSGIITVTAVPPPLPGDGGMADRIEVERFFSRDKHSFGAGLIMTKLDNTTLTSIALSVLAANVFKADVGNFFVLYFKDTEEDVTRHYYMEFEPAA